MCLWVWVCIGVVIAPLSISLLLPLRPSEELWNTHEVDHTADHRRPGQRQLLRGASVVATLHALSFPVCEFYALIGVPEGSSRDQSRVLVILQTNGSVVWTSKMLLNNKS